MRWSTRQAKAATCSPATVSGRRSSSRVALRKRAAQAKLRFTAQDRGSSTKQHLASSSLTISNDRHAASRRTSASGEHEKFRPSGDALQSDPALDLDIVDRMGARFCHQVIVPAIEEARSSSDAYKAIRDSTRKSWKPEE